MMLAIRKESSAKLRRMFRRAATRRDPPTGRELAVPVRAVIERRGAWSSPNAVAWVR